MIDIENKPSVSNPVERLVMCKVNGRGGLACDGENKIFIGKECEFMKVTKAGLYQVRLVSNNDKITSLPKRNIDMYT